MMGKKFSAVALWVLAPALVLTGCSTSNDVTSKDRGQDMTVSADTAAEFGDVVLPPGVEALGVDTDSGRDTRY